jgi:hypothetical protein
MSKSKFKSHIDSDPDSQWGIVTGNIGTVNPVLDSRFWVVDNFYSNPDEIRNFGLSQMYFEGEGAVGWRTRKQFLFDGLKERFEAIMDKKIRDTTPDGTGWFDMGINGRFQSCIGGTPQVFHCDSQQWAAVIYLTPDSPPQSGTSFYRHKDTKVRHASEINWGTDDSLRTFNQNTFMDPTPYERVDTVGNVYNRLVIFDGKLIHSGNDYFGWSIDTGRFFQIFFFDTE